MESRRVGQVHLLEKALAPPRFKIYGFKVLKVWALRGRSILEKGEQIVWRRKELRQGLFGQRMSVSVDQLETHLIINQFLLTSIGVVRIEFLNENV